MPFVPLGEYFTPLVSRDVVTDVLNTPLALFWKALPRRHPHVNLLDCRRYDGPTRPSTRSTRENSGSLLDGTPVK